MLKAVTRAAIILFSATLLAGQIGQAAPGQPVPYQPKFPGDPAHSDAEAAALGYMRTVVNAQRIYHKRHIAYATSLNELVGQGSFTRRLVRTDRGDYTVHFRSTGKEYSLSLVPKQFDDAHRAFYVDETGVYRGETGKPANKESPPVK